MNTTQLAPYLNFNGNCEEAMQFYKSVLGGELHISHFSDFESANMPVPPDYQHKVMHAALTNSPIILMASDAAPNAHVTFGDSVHLSLMGDDEAVLTTYFEGLSAGGVVTMPLAKQVWGDMFGMFTDKFGIHWMVNISAKR